MFFGQPYPVLMQAGMLNPVCLSLEVVGVKVRTGSVAANEVAAFDLTLTDADTLGYDYAGPSSPFGTIVPLIDTSYTNGKLHEAVQVFCVVKTAAADDGTTDVIVIGSCTPTLVAASASRGSTYVPDDDGGVGKLLTPLAPTDTWNATSVGSKMRKIVAVATNAAGTTVMFNGFGFGWHFHQIKA